MTRRIWAGMALAAALLASGCETVRLAAAGPYQPGPAYSVTLGRAWSDVSASMTLVPDTVRVLSIDGPFLNRLYLGADIEPGKGLIEADRRQQNRVPVYRADMTSREIAEMLLETLIAIGYQRAEEDELSPAQFAQSPGVRVTFKAQTREGLEVGALAVAAVLQGKLQVIMFVAPQEYYFQRDLPEVERIIASAIKP